MSADPGAAAAPVSAAEYRRPVWALKPGARDLASELARNLVDSLRLRVFGAVKGSQ